MAEQRVKLWRVAGGVKTLVKESTSATAQIIETVSQPGAYYVEVWIKPKHLAPALVALGRGPGDQGVARPVAGQRHLGASAQGVAVDGRDGWLFESDDPP